jgi:cob(I)alamin adenosyltransferase
MAKKTRTPVTTRRGDGGYTSLWGGDEVAKHDPRVDAYGTVDEATAVLGQARLSTRHAEVRRHLVSLQLDLFRLTSELAAGRAKAGEHAIETKHVSGLEARIFEVRDTLDLPAKFVVSATPTAATLDVARTVIRRAERLVARLLHDGLVDNPETLRLLNRASDLAFVLARLDERLEGVAYMTVSGEDIV